LTFFADNGSSAPKSQNEGAKNPGSDDEKDKGECPGQGGLGELGGIAL